MIEMPSMLDWNASNDKNVTKKLLLLQFQFLLAPSRTTVHAYDSNEQRYWRPGAPSFLNSSFANQFKCITQVKSRVFVLKVATSGPHLALLCSNAITKDRLTMWHSTLGPALKWYDFFWSWSIFGRKMLRNSLRAWDPAQCKFGPGNKMAMNWHEDVAKSSKSQGPRAK